MSRTGKIDARGPVKSSTYLKKHIMTLHPDPRIGRSVEYDVVEYSVAKKACQKALVEGQVNGVDLALDIIFCAIKENQLSTSPVLNGADILKRLNKLKDEILSRSI